MVDGAIASCIHQHTAFASHCFGDQKTRGTFNAQSRWMKLHEFQIFHGCSGLPGKGHALTTGLGWIGGVGEQVASPSAGQHDRTGPDPLQFWPIEDLNTAATVVLYPEFGDAYPTSMKQTMPFFDPILKDFHQGSAGSVLHMQHPVMAMGGFQGGGQVGSIAIERHPQAQEPIHEMGGVLNQ